ncbi:MAG TPA: flagellar biosynthesis protein FlgB [Actinomycetota bacterium]|nr:flagellar biosynthesis protein FlgB [Actinomycetota bacterium]
MDGINDLTMGVIEYALDGLAKRAEVRAHNVANLDTPGFMASTVAFEDVLAAALEDGDLGDLTEPPVVPRPDMPDPLGNTVSLDAEVVEAMKDDLLFDTLINSYDFKLEVLRTAIGVRA